MSVSGVRKRLRSAAHVVDGDGCDDGTMTRAFRTSLLERYRLNELPDAADAAIERRCRRRPGRPRRGSRRSTASDEEIRERYSPSRRSCATARRRRAGWSQRCATAAARRRARRADPGRRVAVDDRRGAPSPATETRLKGDASSGRPVARGLSPHGRRQRALADGAVARPGDLLRVGYASRGTAVRRDPVDRRPRRA